MQSASSMTHMPTLPRSASSASSQFCNCSFLDGPSCRPSKQKTRSPGRARRSVKVGQASPLSARCDSDQSSKHSQILRGDRSRPLTSREKAHRRSCVDHCRRDARCRRKISRARQHRPPCKHIALDNARHTPLRVRTNAFVFTMIPIAADPLQFAASQAEKFAEFALTVFQSRMPAPNGP